MHYDCVKNSFNFKQIRNDNNDEIISYQHANNLKAKGRARSRDRGPKACSFV